MKKEIKNKKDIRELPIPLPPMNKPLQEATVTTPALITTQLNTPYITNEQAQADVDELEEMFSGEGQTESSILKELFNTKNIKVKTRVSTDEVSIISRLFTMAEITKRPLLSKITMEFITLKVSEQGKSRAEFVEAHKDRNEQKARGLFGNIFGGNGGV